MVKKQICSALEWAAVSTAAFFYGKTAGLAVASAVFIYVCCKTAKGGLVCRIGLFCLGILAGFLALRGTSAASRPLYTLAPAQNITFLSGRLEGNPVMTQSRRYYAVPLRVSNAGTGSIISTAGKRPYYIRPECLFSASGTVRLLIPASLVEACLPGKLYTISRGQGEETLFEEGLEASFTVTPFKIERTEGAELFIAENCMAENWSSAFLRLRARMRAGYRRVLWNWKSAGGLFLALTSGAREYLEPELAEGFTAAGLAHILALSGMHLSLLGGCVLWAGTKTCGKNAGILLSSAAVLFFIQFAGASPSLTRAFIFSNLFSAGAISGLPLSGIPVLACTFIIQLLLYPSDGLSASFMLSYAALIGIMTTGNLLNRCLRGKIPDFLLASVSVSCGAQTATAPLTIYFFSVVTPAGIIASVLVSPLITLFLAAGSICLAVSLCMPALADAAAVLPDAIYRCIKGAVLFFARIPPLHIEGRTGTIILLLIIIFICRGVYIVDKRKKRNDCACFTGL